MDLLSSPCCPQCQKTVSSAPPVLLLPLLSTSITHHTHTVLPRAGTTGKGRAGAPGYTDQERTTFALAGVAAQVPAEHQADNVSDETSAARVKEILPTIAAAIGTTYHSTRPVGAPCDVLKKVLTTARNEGRELDDFDQVRQDYADTLPLTSSSTPQEIKRHNAYLEHATLKDSKERKSAWQAMKVGYR